MRDAQPLDAVHALDAQIADREPRPAEQEPNDDTIRVRENREGPGEPGKRIPAFLEPVDPVQLAEEQGSYAERLGLGDDDETDVGPVR